jgi:hypothetical protein
MEKSKKIWPKKRLATAAATGTTPSCRTDGGTGETKNPEIIGTSIIDDDFGLRASYVSAVIARDKAGCFSPGPANPEFQSALERHPDERTPT